MWSKLIKAKFEIEESIDYGDFLISVFKVGFVTNLDIGVMIG